MKARLVGGVVVLLMAACGGNKIVVNGIEVYEKEWNRALEGLEPRVAYDFDCPAEQIEFTLLRRHGRTPVEVGAEGCGRRGTYTRPVVESRASGSWFLDGASTRSE